MLVSLTFGLRPKVDVEKSRRTTAGPAWKELGASLKLAVRRCLWSSARHWDEQKTTAQGALSLRAEGNRQLKSQAGVRRCCADVGAVGFSFCAKTQIGRGRRRRIPQDWAFSLASFDCKNSQLRKSAKRKTHKLKFAFPLCFQRRRHQHNNS